MIKKFRTVIVILICFTSILTCYLAIIKPPEIKDIAMVDSFEFASKDHDTLSLSHPIPDIGIKDMVFSILCESDEYGGMLTSISSIGNGESFFDRKFEVVDSTLIYGGKKIRVGETFEDILQYKPYRNIFKIERNKLSIKNEGFIKATKTYISIPDSQQTILLKKPVLFISGKSYDSTIINRSTMTFYRTLPYILVFLGLTFFVLSFILRIRSKIASQNKDLVTSDSFKIGPKC